MNSKLVALAVPFFFVLILVEVLVSRAQREKRYRFQDSITDLSCGLGEQVLLPFFKTIMLGGYAFLYARRAYSFSSGSVLAWVLLLIGVDVAYYAFHRASHRVNFIWATHVVHHQSEEYNLAVALRQSWFFKLIEPVFYLPLAVAGFPPEMFVVMSTLNTLYQFWIHTRAVGKLGPFEWFMNTPSHHRVHHGINPKYIDKNYAGVFIVWDRMFGTFQAEEDEPVYGLVKPLASYNPVWANVHYWFEMARMAGDAKGFADKVKVWFAPPEWRPASLGGKVTVPEVSRAAQRKYDVKTSRALNAYVVAQFVIVGAAMMTINVLQSSLSELDLAIMTAPILATLLAWGALFEAKRWAVPFELARLCCVPVAVAMVTHGSALFFPATGVAIAASLVFCVWLLALSRATGASRTTAEAEAPSSSASISEGA